MDLDSLAERIAAGDRRALARALTLVESRSPAARELLTRLFSGGRRAKIVGLTGPPGVGKSSLADVLAKLARQRGRHVAVLAIDPTSPFSGGALLGDRARMESSASDPEVFVRSMATRGHVGGLASAAFEALVLLESAKRDFILLETVGAGQDEIEVAAVADVTILVLAPGLGDHLQAAKAGLMEVADVLVVNKADRDGADRLAGELRTYGGGKPVLATNALDGAGVEALLDETERHQGERKLIEAWLWNVVEELLRSRIPGPLWSDMLKRVSARELTPYDAAETLLASVKP